jgi:hypothetical protein
MRTVQVVVMNGVTLARARISRHGIEEERWAAVVDPKSPRAYVWFGGKFDGRERFFGTLSIASMRELLRTHSRLLAAARRRRRARQTA